MSSSYVSGSHFCFSENRIVIGPCRSLLFTGINGVLLKDRSGSFKLSTNGSRFRIVAMVKKGKKHDYPWPDDIDPNWKSEHLIHLSHFKPHAEKAKPVTLPFEKPLADLEKKISDVRKMADETGLDFSDQINSLESKYQQAVKDLYKHLTPIQRVSLARHPNRPTFLDHVFNITDKWVELHGDRAGYDDPSVVTGIGTIDGKTYMFIGQQKGRNTKENIHRNFGMPTPHGYRKALRMMHYADHHEFPIITFIDTPGAFADLKSEELGQGEAIARNLRTMFGLKVPIVSVVIGEGGSGGALAIGCANKLFMLENSVFYVASPEACAAILWKNASAAPKAAEQLRITPGELLKFKIIDGIIPEPLGGAQADPAWTSQQIKLVVMQAMDELLELDKDSLLKHRWQKFRSLGVVEEGVKVDPERRRNMVPSYNAPATSGLEEDIENLKKKVLEAKQPSNTIYQEAIEKLRKEVDLELTEAFISMGLGEKLKTVKTELAKSDPSTQKDNVDQLMKEFKQALSQTKDYSRLKQKMEMLARLEKFVEMKAKGEILKREINQKPVGGKLEALKMAKEKVAAGEPLDEDLKEAVENAMVELAEVFKSANLEVVGVRKKPPPPPDLAEKIERVNVEIEMEIEKAVNLKGLKSKIEKLKAEMSKGLSKDMSKLEELREEIVAAMDLTELKGKVESLTAEIGGDETEKLDEGGGKVEEGNLDEKVESLTTEGGVGETEKFDEGGGEVEEGKVESLTAEVGGDGTEKLDEVGGDVEEVNLGLTAD